MIQPIGFADRLTTNRAPTTAKYGGTIRYPTARERIKNGVRRLVSPAPRPSPPVSYVMTATIHDYREVEEDTPEGFEKRKQLVGLLVESISLGKSQEGGRAEVQITYRFGPPPASDAESDDSFMPGLKNGSRS